MNWKDVTYGKRDREKQGQDAVVTEMLEFIRSSENQTPKWWNLWASGQKKIQTQGKHATSDTVNRVLKSQRCFSDHNPTYASQNIAVACWKLGLQKYRHRKYCSRHYARTSVFDMPKTEEIRILLVHEKTMTLSDWCCATEAEWKTQKE